MDLSLCSATWLGIPQEDAVPTRDGGNNFITSSAALK